MRKSKFTAEQVACALNDYESKIPVEIICKRLDISIATFYNWRKKFAGLAEFDLQTMIEVQEEHRALSQKVDDLLKDRDLLQSIIANMDCLPGLAR